MLQKFFKKKPNMLKLWLFPIDFYLFSSITSKMEEGIVKMVRNCLQSIEKQPGNMT